jgi:hypothetical protein
MRDSAGQKDRIDLLGRSHRKEITMNPLWIAAAWGAVAFSRFSHDLAREQG